MSTVIAFDPSLTATGYAVIVAGKVVEHGAITLDDGADLPERLIELARDVRGIVGGQVEPYPDAIVVERPESKHRGGGSWANISPFTLTKYGAAFGTVLTAAAEMMPKSAVLLTPTPSEWVGRGRIPSSANDPGKSRRVAFVEATVPEVRGAMGPKTRAGDVADAILLGLWGRTAAPLAIARRKGA